MTFPIMKLQIQSFEILHNLAFYFQEKVFVAMKNNKIIHIPKIVLTTQFFLNVMVHPIEIDVGKKLRREIAYRNAYDWTAKLAPSLSYF